MPPTTTTRWWRSQQQSAERERRGDNVGCRTLCLTRDAAAAADNYEAVVAASMKAINNQLGERGVEEGELGG
jgi:hypothetical protein